MKDQVAIIGVGCTKFGDRFDKSYEQLICDAAFEAYADAGVDPAQIDAAYLGTYLPGSGGGQDARGTYFAMYAAWLEQVFGGLFSYTLRDAWRLANTLVEGSDVQWAYLRATSPTANTYNEKLTTSEPNDPSSNRSFWTARGSC